MSIRHSAIIILFCLGLMSGFSQNFTSYFTGNTTDVTPNPLGGVCLMGGATENDNAMRWFLQRASGGDILVLRASGSDGYNDYIYNQLGVTVNSVETIVFHNASASNEAYIHQKIQNAEAIWFAGGDQWDYVSYWRNTMIQSLINSAIQNRNIVIGGTSAGMAIQGAYYFTAEHGTITSANALANPYTTNVTLGTSTFITNNFLDDVITDTHYDNSDRRGRHTTFLARLMTDFGYQAKGIACDEFTAVCIDTNGIASVYGGYPTYDDNAYFIQPNCELANTLPENCTSGTPLDWDLNAEALKVYNVKGTQNGTHTFDLSDWETGNGGVWQHWSVNNGTLVTQSGTAINCSSLSNGETLDTKSFTVYPNPAQYATTIYAKNKSSYTYSLYDISGKLILNNTLKGTQTLDTSELKQGLYFITISDTDSQRRELIKLIKH